MTASRFLIYACSEGLDLLSQAYLLPWGFWFVVHSFALEGHWGHAVISYGSLVAVMSLGRFFGRLCSPLVVSTSDVIEGRAQQVFGMLLLAGAAMVLTLTNRYALVLLAFFSSGFGGATLVGISSPSYPLIGGLCLGGDFDYALGSNSVSHVGALRLTASASGMHSSLLLTLPGQAADMDSAGRNAILIFTFVTLCSGLLYGEGTHGTSSIASGNRQSALGPCLALSVICLLCAALYISTNRIAYKRMQWSCWMCCCCCGGQGQGGRGRGGGGMGDGFVAACMGVCESILSYLPKEQKREAEVGSDVESGSGSWSGLGSGNYPNSQQQQAEQTQTMPLLAPSQPIDPSSIPAPFLEVHLNNLDAAGNAYAATLAWRRRHSVDSLMATPQDDFYQVCSM